MEVITLIGEFLGVEKKVYQPNFGERSKLVELALNALGKGL